MTTTRQRHTDQADAIARLQTMLSEGDTLHVVTKSVARSGMSRGVDVFKFYVREDGKIGTLWLTRLVARALGWRFNTERETLTVQGCGMDMHFHTVYELSATLFGDGYKLTKASL